MAEHAWHWHLPRPLERGHATDRFHCGFPGIDDWLARFAWEDQRAGMTRVYVSEREGRIAGFYALSTGGVEAAPATASPARPEGAQTSAATARRRAAQVDAPAREVPVILLTRLAVDTHWQGHGLGRALLRDALLRVASVAQAVAVGALLVHCVDESARDFYLDCAEFEPSPTDPLHLLLPIRDPRRLAAHL